MGPKINKDKVFFSLDIGTRTIIGIVGVYQDSVFKILASEVIEHDKRNMYDGQIHDISGVVKIVERVKKGLEEKLGFTLENVAIAAAGRALITHRIRMDRDVDFTREINKRLIESIEMEAIQKAQEIIDEDRGREDSKYYCVGYTVVSYYLDNIFLENPEGHRGSKLSVDLLATFLPHVVVDSLYTVMNRVNLEVVNMTLEPIAAINVAIKKNLRLLNLALVDIGAGTSDIAITRDGSIVAYGMASAAGDEITEAIAKAYLLDYDTAEEIKVKLNKEDHLIFDDAVGIEHQVTVDDVLKTISGAIQDLAKEITEQILTYNEKAPSAVFIIGGGGQIPGLTKYIAQYLKLPKERVVIRDTRIIKDVIDIPEGLKGPHAITPIGIAMTAINNVYKDFLEVIVNDKKIKLFNSKTIKVSDALVLVGYNPKKLIPKRGKSFYYFINERKEEVKGQLGEPAEIYVNHKPANLENPLKTGDVVQVNEATEGKQPQLRLHDCIYKDASVLFNGKVVNTHKRILVNGIEVKENIEIKENDKIVVEGIETIQGLFTILELDSKNYNIFLNDKRVSPEESIEKDDKIRAEPIRKNTEKKAMYKTIHLKVNGENKSFDYKKASFVFVDLFNHIDFDLTRTKGSLILRINGEKAVYTQKLKNEDVIEIYWKQEPSNP